MSAATATSRITPENILRARTLAQQTQQRLMDVLEQEQGLTPESFIAQLAASLHYVPLTMAQLQALEPAFEMLSFTECLQHDCMVLHTEKGGLLLALGDPFLDNVQTWAEHRIPQPFGWALAHRNDLTVCLARHEENMRAMDILLPAHGGATLSSMSVDSLSLKSIAEDASPVVKLVHSTLYDALKAGVSDIHLETDLQGLTIKYRIDGVLSTVGSAPGAELADQVVSRIKVMSELDIAERRIPQDGRFKVTTQGREIDFRVSIMPSVFGEDAVLRILDKRSLADQMTGLRLDYLGFDEGSLVTMRRMAKEPYGMVLVTGPTGSGKTTTLYAMISEINHGHDKIITIEDPVEYQLPGILQIPVNEKKGLTFARGLRSILRHDPDKIMVGEIRDAETAQIAIQSALTGHLVFTTVHANNVFDVLGRFMHMGVDPYSFVSALNGILAQRLVRINCPHCIEEDQPDEQLLIDSGLTAGVSGFKFQRSRGCAQCRGSGYKGRKAVAELLYLNDEIRELIITREPIRRIKEAAKRGGTHYLRESAMALVQNGETTLQEINRVTFVA